LAGAHARFEAAILRAAASGLNAPSWGLTWPGERRPGRGGAGRRVV